LLKSFFFILKTKLSMRNNDILALLTVGLLALLAVFPFLNNPGLPAMNDAELHIYRIAELGYSIQGGDLYPRWAPDFFHGYGYPIFNYYAPFSYHLGYYLSLGNPGNAAAAAKMLFIMCAFVGAYGAYFLAKFHSSRGGGLVGAAAFCFSPYIQLINPHSRGDLAEVVALSFLPWTVFLWQQLWHDPRKSTFVWAVLSASATLLSHNLTGLCMLIILTVMAVWEWVILKNRRSTIWIIRAGLVFVLMTSFFWFPFLAERKDILLNVAGEGHYDFRNHFIRVGELLSRVKPFDYRDASMAIPFCAGPAQILLAVAGGIAALLSKNKRTTLYILLSSLFFFLITSASKPVWEITPGLAYFQFPWRFLGPLAVTLVPLVANSTQLLKAFRLIQVRDIMVTSFSAGLVGVIILLQLPALYPIPWLPGFTKITQLTIIQAELQGRWRGTTSTNDFVPSTVEMLPHPENSVIASYHHTPVDRVNRFTLPENTSVEVLDDMPNHFSISTEKAFLLRLYVFYFPGWRVYVDNVESTIEIAHPEGFVTVNIPEGQHEVSLKFGPSTNRWISGWLSLLGVILGVGVLAFVQPRSFQKVAAVTESPGYEKDNHAVAFTFILVLLFHGINVFILNPGQLMHYSSKPDQAAPAQVHLNAVFEDQITLLGYDILGKVNKQGQTLEVQLYWQAVKPITRTYQTFVHVMLPDGQILTQSDHLNPGGYPTNLWTEEKYIRDKHFLKIPEYTPPGEYRINVGIYSINTGERLFTYNPQTGMMESFVTLKNSVDIRR
jgi:hypothetical protein